MDRKESADYNYGEISVGMTTEFEKRIAEEDIRKFAELTGDFNPLHVDKEYAKKTEFKGNIAHGMLAASLFSTLLGMYCPGRKNIYLSQTLNFRKPVKPNSLLKIKGEITGKTESLKLLTIKTSISCGGEVLIDGEAKVKVRE